MLGTVLSIRNNSFSMVIVQIGIQQAAAEAIQFKQAMQAGINEGITQGTAQTNAYKQTLASALNGTLQSQFR